ncbi:hypothetical protein BEL07_25505 [Mycolicibacterium grossiae]|uniref:Uncharacterized protein n=1 Tax=Mycolicibacterium grossiae TaxID=1552759 RepID=A0A1E8PXV0_9MYCO|nr:hypothetical protein [Mycolicibacterium grossiae]OFJ50926.1 hypothetical protein BEL07_25505 [Mycolicibacterium grossiae]
MTADAHPHHTVQKPRRRTDPVDVADFTMLVRVPDRPDLIRSFTDAEESEAHKYASETGGSVVPLPLPPPSGYTVDPDGNLIPALPPTCAGMADTPRPVPDAPVS